jgi:hypothetical protein
MEPCVETLGYLVIILGFLLGISNTTFVLLFLLLVWGYNALTTFFCILIEDFGFNKYRSFRTVLLLLFTSLIENFGYKQLTIIWRIRGFKDFFKELSLVRKTGIHLKNMLKQSSKKGKTNL